MSNPFKEKNTRFSKDAFFSDDEIKKKEKKVDKTYDHVAPNVNTFLVENKDRGKDDNNRRRDNNRTKDRDTYRNPKMFSSKTKEEKQVQPDFVIKNEDFPELVQSTDSNLCEQPTEAKNFLDAVNTVNIVEEDKDKDKIKDGWIVMTKGNNNQVLELKGELTIYQQKQEKLRLLEENPNFIMEKIGTALCEKWEKRIQDYDAIHGEGAYENVYYLPPVYDDFYKYEDTDSDNDDNMDNYDMDDYSDYGSSDYENKFKHTIYYMST